MGKNVFNMDSAMNGEELFYCISHDGNLDFFLSAFREEHKVQI